MPVVEGDLVLADISGYTKFITETEIEHSHEIVAELLDTMVHSMDGKLDLTQVEGDCVLFIGGLTEEQVVNILENTFIAFHRRVRAMKEGSTCPCAACQGVVGLRLKFVVHRGSYSIQSIGGVKQLHGADVIAAFRLLKNHVPSHEYLLVTKPVLERLPAERAARFTPHQEEYEHIGIIECGYEEMTPLWDRTLKVELRDLSTEEPKRHAEVPIALSPDEMWEAINDPSNFALMLSAESVDLGLRGARGGSIDAVYHCHHGSFDSQIRMMEERPPMDRLIMGASPWGPMHWHIALKPEERGSMVVMDVYLPGDPGEDGVNYVEMATTRAIDAIQAIAEKQIAAQ